MTLQQLRCFAEAAKVNTFAKAAENMCMTQPAFSMTIHNLEGELDTSLFHRSNKGSTLTEDGRKFYPYVMKALQSIEKGRETIASDGSDILYKHSDHIID